MASFLRATKSRRTSAGAGASNHSITQNPNPKSAWLFFVLIGRFSLSSGATLGSYTKNHGPIVSTHCFVFWPWQFSFARNGHFTLPSRGVATSMLMLLLQEQDQRQGTVTKSMGTFILQKRRGLRSMASSPINTNGSVVIKGTHTTPIRRMNELKLKLRREPACPLLVALHSAQIE